MPETRRFTTYILPEHHAALVKLAEAQHKPVWRVIAEAVDYYLSLAGFDKPQLPIVKPGAIEDFVGKGKKKGKNKKETIKETNTIGFGETS